MDAPEINFKWHARERMWQANIFKQDGSHHHGLGRSQEQALFNAAFHWLAAENSVLEAFNLASQAKMEMER